MHIVDSLSEVNNNYDGTTAISSYYYSPVSQSFTGDGNKIAQAKFYLVKGGSPTGNIIVYLYAHTGTFGASSNPTGSALATSNPVLAQSVSSNDFGLITFTFPKAQQYQMVKNTKYEILIDFQGGDALNFIGVGASGTSTPPNTIHGGNKSRKIGPNWDSMNDMDLVFYVYGYGRNYLEFTDNKIKSYNNGVLTRSYE